MRFKKEINKENSERILLEMKKIVLNEPYYDVMVAFKHFNKFISDPKKWVHYEENDIDCN